MENCCIFCGAAIPAGAVYCAACEHIAETLEPGQRRALERLLADEQARVEFNRDFQRIKETIAQAMRPAIDAIIHILERIAAAVPPSEEE